jgi:serine/threonine protein kinase
VIIRGVQHSRIHNERDVLLKFQEQTPLRRLLDEIVQPSQPPGIVLQHLDDDLLAAGKKKRLNRAEIKHIAKIILQALAILHKEGYVHTDI